MFTKLRRLTPRVIRVGVLALGTALAPVAASAHSLADALAFAYDKSNLLQQQRFLMRATTEGVAQAQAAFRPTISYFNQITQSGINGPSDSFSATLGLSLDWTISAGGSRVSRVRAQQESVLAARFQLISVEQQVLFNAASAFLQLREDIQAVALRESNLRLITRELRAAEDRFEVGEVTRTDVEIARARLASARSALAAAQGAVEISRSAYALAIGREPQTLIVPPRPPQLPGSESSAVTLAVQTHPSIRALQAQVRALEYLATAADQDRLGTLTGSADFGFGEINGSERTTGQLGLRFNQPIYTGGRLSSVARAAAANLEASRFELKQQALIITDSVRQSWAGLQVANAQVVASQQQVRAAELAFEGVREEARLGARTTLDVLNQEQELLDARNAVLTAQTEAYLAVYRVLSAVGLLTTRHLGLNVEQYDPSDYFNAVSNAPATSSTYGSQLDRVLRRSTGIDN